MAQLTRRTFTAAGAAGVGLLLCTPTANALDRALKRTASRTVSTAGTTLEQVATAVSPGTATYSRLTGGPGWPLVVRGELAAPKDGRDDRRTALGAFVQFTDLHITDTESPARFEYLHPYVSSAHRPQEALGAAATSALVQRVNSVAKGPFTGRPFDFLVTTGDNTDNHELLELDWFLTSLNGGAITPNSGDPSRYEGVQASGNATRSGTRRPRSTTTTRRRASHSCRACSKRGSRRSPRPGWTCRGSARSATTTTAWSAPCRKASRASRPGTRAGTR